MDALTAKVLAVVRDKRAERRIRQKLPRARLEFATVTNAVAAATRSRPDVIVLDVALPGEDGFQMLQTLRLRRETRDAGIVWVTASERARSSSPLQYGLDQLPDAVADCFRERTMYAAVREAVGRANEQAAAAPAALTIEEQRALASGGVPIGGQLALRPVAARAAKYHAILSGSLNAEQAARRLGVTTGRVRQRLLADPPTLYGIRDGNVWRLPAFQFASKGLIPNVDRVIPQLDRELDPVAVENWFHQPHIDLEQDGHLVSPLDWLAQGRNVQPVAALASDL
jgi:CheY-like chemotaxis protein